MAKEVYCNGSCQDRNTSKVMVVTCESSAETDGSDRSDDDIPLEMGESESNHQREERTTSTQRGPKRRGHVVEALRELLQERQHQDPLQTNMIWLTLILQREILTSTL